MAWFNSSSMEEVDEDMAELSSELVGLAGSQAIHKTIEALNISAPEVLVKKESFFRMKLNRLNRSRFLYLFDDGLGIQRFFDQAFNFVHQFGVVLQQRAHSIAALTEFGLAVAEPRS